MRAPAPARRCIVALAIAALAPAGCGGLPRLGGASSPAGLNPRQAADVQVSLGRSLESDGDSDKALACYREAARLDPRRPDAPLRAAVLLDRQGRFSESGPFYDAALKASPGDAGVFCDRGYSLGLQGRVAEAEAAYRQAIAREPGLARAHNNLGLLLGRAGRTDDALAEFRAAGLADADAHLNLAFALASDRRPAEARAEIAVARRLGSRAPAVLEGADGLDALLARAGAPRAVDAAVARAAAGR